MCVAPEKHNNYLLAHLSCTVKCGFGYGYNLTMGMGMGTGTGTKPMGMGTGTSPWVWVRVRVRDHGYGYGYGSDMSASHGYGYGYGFETMGTGTGMGTQFRTRVRVRVWVRVRVLQVWEFPNRTVQYCRHSCSKLNDTGHSYCNCPFLLVFTVSPDSDICLWNLNITGFCILYHRYPFIYWKCLGCAPTIFVQFLLSAPFVCSSSKFHLS